MENVRQSVSSGGGTPERPPEMGKIVVENWCYPPGVSPSGEEAEIQEMFSKNFGEMSIFNRDVYWKISKFSFKCSNFSAFLVQTLNVLQVYFLIFQV